MKTKLYLLSILFFLLSFNLFAYNDKDNNVTVSINYQEQTIKIETDTQIQNIKFIKNNEVILESAGVRGNGIQIPIESLETGSYVIRIQTENNIEYQRINIQK